MSVQLGDVVPIKEDKEFQYYASNDRRFKGTIQIPLEKVENFIDAVKSDKITVEKWEARIIQK
ncbi:MAG: hypothetical protein DRG78_02840 [Epsilonproteobacteria bacterium]|nr:MAG: hypothetical protein DRG78_02840 [Campylobacterota bacterium]